MANTASATLLAFAYGSNMLLSRIKGRCPSAAALGVAELRGYELRWHKRSQDGSGKCDVIAVDEESAVVFGVLYRIAVDEKPALDEAEGLGNGYEEQSVTVMCNGKPLAASAYCATAVDVSLSPYTWYKALVVAGAVENALPTSYVKGLESTEAKDDCDRDRNARNMRIISGSRGTE